MSRCATPSGAPSGRDGVRVAHSAAAAVAVRPATRRMLPMQMHGRPDPGGARGTGAGVLGGRVEGARRMGQEDDRAGRSACVSG